MIANHLQARSLRAALVLQRDDVVLIDTETTGLGDDAQVLELAIITPAGGTLFNSPLRPTCPIEPAAQAVHGLTEAALALAEAPTLATCYDQIRRLVFGRYVLAYNRAFDVRVLAQTAAAQDVPPLPITAGLCLMEEFAYWQGDWNPHRHSYRWKPLDYALSVCAPADRAMAEAAPPHSALGDALAALAVLRFLAAPEAHAAQARPRPGHISTGGR